MHIHRTAQVAFVFGGFLGQNVAFESLTAFNGTTWTNAKAFFRAAFGLHLGHVDAPYGFCLILGGRHVSAQRLWGPIKLTICG
jgi:hypothetical protein